MSIDVIFNTKTRSYTVTKDEKKVISFPDAYIQSNGAGITAPDIAKAAKEVFDSPESTKWDIIQNPDKKKNAFYSRLGMFDNRPEA